MRRCICAIARYATRLCIVSWLTSVLGNYGTAKGASRYAYSLSLTYF
jgi:hypothetical protein